MARDAETSGLMRVAMVGPGLGVRGGISAVAKSLVDAMPDGTWNLRYVSTYEDGPKPLRACAAAVGFVRLALLLIFWKPDIVHIHSASRASYWRKATMARLSLRAGSRVVFHVHGGAFKTFYEGLPPSKREHVRETLERADLVIALTERWKQRLEEIAPEASVRVLMNPVDCERFAATVVGRSPVPDDGGTVLFLGALDRRKGTFDLMEAGLTVAAARPKVMFEFGGDKAVEEVRAEAAARGLSDNVRVLGWVRGDEKIDAFRRAHVFVLPSYREGLPVAVLEAMAAGLPIVTTPVGGIPNVIADGQQGFFIEPGDVSALAARILEVLGNADLRASMSRRNMEVAARDHDAAALAEELRLWYDELMSGSSAP